MATFFKGATAYEAQIGRVCFRLPFFAYVRAGCWPSVYIAPKDEPDDVVEPLPPGCYTAKIRHVEITADGRVNVQLDLSYAKRLD